MKMYNEDYYNNLGDEIATEALGVKEAHLTIAEMEAKTRERRENIERLKRQIPQKEEKVKELKADLLDIEKSAQEFLEEHKGQKMTKELKDKKDWIQKEHDEAEEALSELQSKILAMKDELDTLEKEELEAQKANSADKRRKSKKDRRPKRRQKIDPKDYEDVEDDVEDVEDTDEVESEKLNAEAVEAFARLLDDDAEAEDEDAEVTDDATEDTGTPNANAKDGTDYSTTCNIVPRMIVVKEDKDMAVRRVNDLEFYNNLGHDALDFDRGKGMTGSLRDWIKSAISDDEEISESIITQLLPDILSKDPDLIGLVKEVLIAAEEENVPYIPVFVSKIDGTRFYDKSDAEASIDKLLKAGVVEDFYKAFEVKYQLAEFENVVDAPFVEQAEVEAFVKNFDGDRDALRQQLYLKKPNKKQNPAEDKSDKKDDSKA